MAVQSHSQRRRAVEAITEIGLRRARNADLIVHAGVHGSGYADVVGVFGGMDGYLRDEVAGMTAAPTRLCCSTDAPADDRDADAVGSALFAVPDSLVQEARRCDIDPRVAGTGIGVCNSDRSYTIASCCRVIDANNPGQSTVKMVGRGPSKRGRAGDPRICFLNKA